MLLSQDELNLIRDTLEGQSGMDSDLVHRCSTLFYNGAYDPAVQQAFVLLEERLRKSLKMDGATGINMVNAGFSDKGLFSKLLADNPAESEGLKSLFTGAFKLYRNPAAHTVVNYTRADARAIIALVDMMLRKVSQLAALPLPGALPANAEQVLSLTAKNVDLKSLGYVRSFLAKCTTLGLFVDPKAVKWIPFRMRALIQRDGWPAAKPHTLAVFYLLNSDKDQGLWFPINTYYKYVVGINTENYIKRLLHLKFHLTEGHEPYLSVAVARDKNYFDELFTTIQEIVHDLDATLHPE